MGDAVPAFALCAVGVRKLTEEFTCMVESTAPRVRAIAPDSNDLSEAVARRLSNSAPSRYECSADACWPTYAMHSPGLKMRFRLERPGMMTYRLGDGTDSGGYGSPGTWELI